MRQQQLEAWRKANPEAGYRFFLDNEDPKTWEELEFVEEAWGPTGRRLLKDANEGERPMVGQRGFGPRGRQTYRDHRGTLRFDMTGIPTAPRSRSRASHTVQVVLK